jgi:excisionase family DNA binding protein
VYLNVAEVAELLGVKECYIRRLVAEHRIPHHKLGKYLRFDRDEVLDWMAANRIEPLR